MATYNPPSFPRRPKNSNVFTEAKYQLHLTYYRYEINTALYVMSPGEKTAFNLVLLSLITFLAFGVYYYLPRATVFGLHRLAYYLTGTQRLASSMAAPAPNIAHELFQSTSEAMSSLSDQGMRVLNATASLAG